LPSIAKLRFPALNHDFTNQKNLSLAGIKTLPVALEKSMAGVG
jgi:hypothetical protein